MPSALSSRLSQVPGAGSYRPVFRQDVTNHCPGCGRTQWLIGRMSAQCAFCATAVPLQEGSVREAYTHDAKPVFFTRGAFPNPGDMRGS